MFFDLFKSRNGPVAQDLKTRLLKAEFAKKLAENPDKKFIALYMHNKTHTEACEKFYKMLFEDKKVKDQIEKDFVLFKVDVTDPTCKEGLLIDVQEFKSGSDLYEVGVVC